MAHYGMLRDYGFAADVDDIRGADLYASDGKIGKVKDVLFDHDSGDIRYLVTDIDDRRVLVPSSHVFRSVNDEDSFEIDLTKAEAANLPRFDEKALSNERDWEKHRDEHRHFWKEKEDRYEAEYKNKWEEDPVMHQKDSTNLITPETEPAGGGERIITGADLTPRRISDKFQQRPTMTAVSTNLSAPDLTLRPSGPAADAEREAWGSWERSERLRDFQNNVRDRMAELRKTCSLCPGGARKVA